MTTRQLNWINARLDAGWTRARIRTEFQRAFNKGFSNARYSELRADRIRTLRSLGHRINPNPRARARINVRDTPRSSLREPVGRQALPLSARPEPPSRAGRLGANVRSNVRDGTGRIVATEHRQVIQRPGETFREAVRRTFEDPNAGGSDRRSGEQVGGPGFEVLDQWVV